jgi:hypothetical protein
MAQRSSPDGSADAGLAIATQPSGDPPAVACDGAEPWMSDAAYQPGKQVRHGTPPHLYECKPWPFSGWCLFAAYEPGKPGAPWEEAWLDLGRCR